MYSPPSHSLKKKLSHSYYILHVHTFLIDPSKKKKKFLIESTLVFWMTKSVNKFRQ